MNHRERVRKAINYTEPDRVPIDNNGLVSGMHETAYRNLLEYLQIEDEIILTDPVQRLALVKQEVRDRLGVDTYYLFPNPPSFWEYKPADNGSWTDEFGSYYERCGYYAEFVKPRLKDADFDEIKNYVFPDPEDSARFEGLRETASELYHNTDYALVGGYLPTLYYVAWVLRGMQQFLEDTMAEPELADYLLDTILDFQIRFMDRYLDEIGDFIEYQWIGDDWGLQHGPFLSPAMMKSSIVPRFQKLISFIKSKTDAKVIYHSCGATYDLLEDFLDMGVDIIQPVQANASGNEDSARLKRDYGRKIMFHGNTNNQGVFHRSKEEVMADALYRIKNLAPGGGYIFSSGHNIQANMSPENIMTLFATAQEYGKYPIDADRIDDKLSELIAARPEIKEQIPI